MNRHKKLKRLSSSHCSCSSSTLFCICFSKPCTATSLLSFLSQNVTTAFIVFQYRLISLNILNWQWIYCTHNNYLKGCCSKAKFRNISLTYNQVMRKIYYRLLLLSLKSWLNQACCNVSIETQNHSSAHIIILQPHSIFQRVKSWEHFSLAFQSILSFTYCLPTYLVFL